RIAVHMPMPRMDWRAKQIAILPLDALPCFPVRVHLGVAAAENHIEKRFARVAMSGRCTSRWYFAYVSLQILDVRKRKICRCISAVCARVDRVLRQIPDRKTLLSRVTELLNKRLERRGEIWFCLLHAAFFAGCFCFLRDLVVAFFFAPVCSKLFRKTETRSITLVGLGALFGFSSISFRPLPLFLRSLPLAVRHCRSCSSWGFTFISCYR